MDPERFELLGPLKRVQVVASGRGGRVRDKLIEEHGGHNWRKMKGKALIRDSRGNICEATGTKRTASGGSIGRSSGRSSRPRRARRYPFFAICIDNQGNEASLVLGKAYRVTSPLDSDPPGMLRVVDDDAEDYLYDARQFVRIELPANARALLTAAETAPS